jgi:hypothetical protein
MPPLLLLRGGWWRTKERGVHTGKHSHLEVDEDGSLVIPPDLARRYGLAPGATVPVKDLDNHLVLHQPVSLLAKIYLEPTNDCPLACATCMRNAWKEPRADLDRLEPGGLLPQPAARVRGVPVGAGVHPVPVRRRAWRIEVYHPRFFLKNPITRRLNSSG